MKKFKLYIAGSKSCPSLQYLQTKVENLVKVKLNDHQIILSSGDKISAQKMEKPCAKAAGYEFELLPVNRQKYGKAAAFFQNKAAVDNADAILIFRMKDQVDVTLQHLENIAREINKPIRICTLN